MTLALATWFALAGADTVPDFSLRDLRGKRVALSDFEGFVLLNFFATWCSSCSKELPILQRVHEDFGDRGLTVVAVSVDEARHKSQVQQLVRSNDFSFVVLTDPASTTVQTINPQKTIPLTLLLNNEREVLWQAHGFEEEEPLRAAVEAALQ